MAQSAGGAAGALRPPVAIYGMWDARERYEQARRDFAPFARAWDRPERLRACVERYRGRRLRLIWPRSYRVTVDGRLPDYTPGYRRQLRTLYQRSFGPLVAFGTVAPQHTTRGTDGRPPPPPEPAAAVLVERGGRVLLHVKSRDHSDVPDWEAEYTDCLYVVAESLEMFLREGLARFDDAYRDRTVPYGVSLSDPDVRRLLSASDASSGNASALVRLRNALHGRVFRLNGMPGLARDNALVLDAGATPPETALAASAALGTTVPKARGAQGFRALGWTGYLTPSLAASSSWGPSSGQTRTVAGEASGRGAFAPRLLILLDDEARVYGVELTSARVYALAPDLRTFLKIGTLKTIVNPKYARASLLSPERCPPSRFFDRPTSYDRWSPALPLLGEPTVTPSVTSESHRDAARTPVTVYNHPSASMSGATRPAVGPRPGECVVRSV